MWAIYAILGAFAKAFSSVIRKKIAKTDNSVYIFISSGLITIILVVLVSFIANQSLSSVRFAPLTLLIAGLVQIVAIRANLYAFKYEELSYITPMFALTPLYAALIAYFTIGETPSTIGILGIVAIVVGVYAVTTSKKVGVMSTFIRLFKNKGARAGMLIPIAYAVSATLNKDAINHGVSPIASVAMISGVMNLSHSYVLFNKGSVIRKTVRKSKNIKAANSRIHYRCCVCSFCVLGA